MFCIVGVWGLGGLSFGEGPEAAGLIERWQRKEEQWRPHSKSSDNPPHGSVGARSPQSPALAFVSLHGGEPGVTNIRSVTSDCFFWRMRLRGILKGASDGHQAVSAPSRPFQRVQVLHPRLRNPKLKLKTRHIWLHSAVCIQNDGFLSSFLFFNFNCAIWSSSVEADGSGLRLLTWACQKK